MYAVMLRAEGGLPNTSGVGIPGLRGDDVRIAVGVTPDRIGHFDLHSGSIVSSDPRARGPAPGARFATEYLGYCEETCMMAVRTGNCPGATYGF